MIIQDANVSDAKEILLLQKLAYISEAEIYNDFGISPMVQSLDQIEKDFEKCTFLKAVIDNKIIGSVKGCEKEGTCHIGRLVVHPDFQNRGIGTNLLHVIENLFGYKRFELFTGDKSQKNLYLYQKLGYKIFKEQRIDNINYIYLEKIKSLSAELEKYYEITRDIDYHFLSKAYDISRTATNYLNMRVGCVIVKNEEIISSGYNDKGIHAEWIAIKNCMENNISTRNTILYTNLQPCLTCAHLIIASKIIKVIYMSPYIEIEEDEDGKLHGITTDKLLKDNGVESLFKRNCHIYMPF